MKSNVFQNRQYFLYFIDYAKLLQGKYEETMASMIINEQESVQVEEMGGFTKEKMTSSKVTDPTESAKSPQHITNKVVIHSYIAVSLPNCFLILNVYKFEV